VNKQKTDYVPAHIPFIDFLYDNAVNTMKERIAFFFHRVFPLLLNKMINLLNWKIKPVVCSLLETTRIPVKRCVRLSTDSQSDDEEEDNDQENDDSCFILDAKHYGSISRFYNHSCKPNVHIQNVINFII